MKNITVKLHGKDQTLGELNVRTHTGQPEIIQAQKDVNYEFYDDATGVAPDHIVTKREGNDLYVSFEEEGQNPDLIIEDFYGNNDQGLIGLAENGEYYYYVPDTGEVAQYVTNLTPGMIEGQALGGSSFVVPFWLALPAAASIPFAAGLAGLASIGAIAAVASSNGSDSNNKDASTSQTGNSTAAVTGVELGGSADDGYLNAKEVGGQDSVSVPVTIGLNGDVKEGDTVTIDVNGTLSTHTVTADEANAHSITASVDIPSSQDGTVVVKASVTATATGNTPAANSAQDDVIVDTGVPGDVNGDKTPNGADNDSTTQDGAPKVSIKDGGDNALNPTDLDSGKATAEISIPANTKAGDSLVVSTPDGEQTIPVTQEMIDAGKTEVSFTPKADGENNEVTAYVKDPAGNESAKGKDASTSQTGNSTAAVTGVELGGSADDGYLNAKEVGGQDSVSVPVTIGLNGDVKEGDTVTIDVNGTLSTHTVTADEANAHSITASVDIPSSQDGTVVVKASVTATATGNTPAANSAQDDVIVDTGVPGDVNGDKTPNGADNDSTTQDGAPKVSIKDGGDNALNPTDLDSGKATAEISIPANTKAGDSLVVSTPDGEQTIPVTQEMIDAGKTEVSFTPKADGENNEVTAYVKDPAGNESAKGKDASTSQTGNSTAAVTGVELGGSADDGYLNAKEVGGQDSVSVPVTIGLNGDVKEGDTVTIDVNGTLSTHTVTADEANAHSITASVDIPSSQDGTVVVKASVTATATGNTPAANSAQDDVIVDTGVPGDVNGDKTPNGADNDSTTQDGAPKVSIKDGGDNALNPTDLDSGKATAEISIPANTKAGDSLVVSTPDGEQTIPVTQEMIDAGKTEVSFTPKADGENNEVTAYVKDPAGNESAKGKDASTSQTGNSTAAVTGVELGGSADDGYLNAKEVGGQDSVSVPVTIGLNGDVKEGDTVTIDVNGTLSTHTVTADEANAHSITASVDIPSSQDGTVVVKASVTATATGNTPAANSAQDDVIVDTGVPGDVNGDKTPNGADNDSTTQDGAPKVSIKDGGDNALNPTDLDSGKATAEISIPANTKAGDSLVVSTPDGEQTIPVTQEMIDAGKTEVSFTPKADGENNEVTAYVKDPAGNESAKGKDASTSQTGNSTAAVTGVELGGSADDGYLNAKEVGGQDSVSVPVTIGLNGDVKEGDTVTIDVNGTLSTHTVTADEANAHSITASVDIPSSQDGTVVVKASVTATATGNTPAANSAQDDVIVDTGVPGDVNGDKTPNGADNDSTTQDGAPKVSIKDGGDNALNPTDLDSGKATAEISIPANTKAGDSLVVSTPDGEQTIPVTQEMIDAGKTEVSFTPKADGENNEVTAYVKDPAGNESAKGKDASTSQTGNSTAAVTGVELGGSADDGYLNAKEVGGQDSVSVPVTIGLNGDVKEGDTVTIDVNGTLSTHTVTADEANAHSITASVDIPSSQDGTVVVKASVTATATGNTPAANSAQDDVIVDTGVPGDVNGDKTPNGADNDSTTQDGAPKVSIKDGGDNALNPTDLDSGKATAEISIPANTKAGDSLVVSTPDGEQTIPVTQEMIDAGKTEVSFTPKADGENNEVTAYVKDPAGNESAKGKDASTSQTGNSTAAVTGVELGGSADDGYLNAKEVGGQDSVSVPVTIGLNGDVKEGDTVTIDVNGTLSTHTVTADEANAHSITASVDIPSSQDGTVVVKASVTATATGNTPAANSAQDDVIVDTGVPGDVNGDKTPNGADNDSTTQDGAPKVSIKDGGDNALNPTDLDSGKATAEISIPANTKAGDSLVVSTPDGEQTIPVTQEMIDAGKTEVSFTPKADGENNEVTAYVKDPAGNESAKGKDASTSQTGNSTAAVTGVELGGSADDGYLNAKEVGGQDSVSVPVTIGLNGDVKEGDTVTIDVNGTLSTHTVTADEANAHSITASVDIPSSQDGTVVVKASVTATATGNTPAANSAQDDVIVDTGVPGDVNGDKTPNGADNDSTTQDGAPKVSIKDGGDNALNPTDLDSGKATAEISIPANTKAGDSLVVSTPDGEQTIPVTQEMIDAGKTEVSFTPKADGENNEVTAYVKDPAGNESAKGKDASTSQTGNSTAAVTGVELGGSADDGYLNAKEVGGQDSVSVPVTIGLNGDVKEGDTVTIDVNGTLSTHTVTADEANAHSITASVDIPSSQDGTVVVKASVTATATGNTPAANSAQDDVIVDTGVPGDVNGDKTPNGADNDSTTQDGAPKVSIKDGGDNALNPTDLDSGKATAEISIPANTKAGDSLVVSTPDGEQTIPVTQEMIDAGKTEVSFTPKADGENNEVTAYVKDPAGNESAKGKDASTSQTGNSTAAVTGVELGGSADDGYLNAKEVGGQDSVSVPVTIGLNGDVKEGDTVTIDVNGTLSTHTVTADEANAHSITASVDIPSSQDGTVVVKASVTATATGNTPAANSAQDDVIVDTAATVDIKSIGGIRQGSADKNDVYATITSDAKNLVFSGSATNVENGSTVTISIQDDSGHEVSSVTAITNNGSWTSNGIPVNIVQGMKNGTYKAVATVTDAAGNTATDTDLFAVNVNRISPQPVIKSVDNTDVSEGALTNGMQKNVNGSAMGVTDSGSIKFSDGNATRYTVGKTGASDTAGKVYLTTDGLPTDLYAENGTAQGAQVTWNVSGDGKTLTGMADVNGTGSQKVITITLNDAASKSGTDFTQGYTTTLHHAIKHDIVDGQNVKDIAVTAKVTDGVGTVDAQFTVNVYDDTPVVSNNATDVTPVAIQKAPPANVTIMIDYSSSMSIGNREAKVESTIIKVIEKYQENDDARFNLIAFGNGTRQLGGKWVTASEALAILKDPSTSNFALTNTAYPQSGASVGTRISSGTDMDAALKTAMDTFTQSGKLSDAQNISYFFTDADESAGKLVPPKDINTWHTFLDNNNITSYAVGMSGGSNYAEIFKGFGIGYDPNQKNVSAKDVQIDGTHLNAYYTDAQQVQFENHLTGTVKLGTVSSSLFTQNSYTGIASLSGIGADGGYLTSVTVNGKTATWNGTGTLTGGTGIDTSKATADNPIATITTSQGKLTVNFATGEYTYQMNGGLKGAREAVEFIVTDRDGDKANGSQTIEFYAFSANNDIILTNQQSGTLTFNEDVLLANDNSRSPKADITLKGSASGVSQSGDSISVSLPTISAGQTVAEKTTVNKDLSSAQTINSSDFGSVNNASVASGAGWKFVNIEGKAETWDEGTLFSKWDVEFYKVHLKAGDTLNYGYTQTTGQGGDDIQIYNASNQKVSEVQTNGNTATTEVGTFTATQEGDYYVRLSNKQDSSAYKVQLAINDHQSHDFDYTLTESADNTDSAHVSVQQVGGNTITGTDANEVLIGSDGTKALNGGGGDDVLVYHNGIGHYDGGTGSDTLFFNEANLIIDSTVLANKVDNVETLYLAKDGVDQTLTIKASDVFSISGSNQLIIHAGAEDHINLTGFSKGATDNETGLTSYTSGNVTVKIDSYLPDDHIII